MIEAGLPVAPQRVPKGLRHGFGVNAAVNDIPLNMLQKWLGHAQLSTTAIYADPAATVDATEPSVLLADAEATTTR